MTDAQARLADIGSQDVQRVVRGSRVLGSPADLAAAGGLVCLPDR